MMLEALKQAHRAGVPVVSHCEDLSIIDGGIINKGKISEELGVRGMDRASEDSITGREIVLAECSDTSIHIAHVSTRGSVQLIREAKERGDKVTCEICAALPDDDRRAASKTRRQLPHEPAAARGGGL